MKKTILFLLCLSGFVVTAQNNIIIPEEISQKCPDILLKDRIRVTVAEFANSTNGVKNENIDNFSSMLSNALFKVNCYRVLAMKKDDNLLEGVGGRSLIPQAVVTGEITEYFHEEATKRVMMKTTKTTIAHIGLIVQLRNNYTGDILFSESVNTNGESTSSALVTSVRIPGKVGTVLGTQTIGSETVGNIDAAYQDALEKAIIATIALMVDNSERVAMEVRENLPENYDETFNKGTNQTKTSSETQLIIRNVSFGNLTALENKYKGSSWVSSVQKSLKNGIGLLNIQHSGNSDDLVNIIMTQGDLFEITGLDDKSITIVERKK